MGIEAAAPARESKPVRRVAAGSGYPPAGCVCGGAHQRAGAGAAGAPAHRALSCPAHSRAAAPACGHRGSGFGGSRGADGCLRQIRSREEGAVPQLCAVPYPGRDSGQSAHAGLEPARAAAQGPRGRRGHPRADGAAGHGRRAKARSPPRWSSVSRSISNCWAI